LYAPAAGTRFARSPEFGSFHVVGRGRSFALTLRSAPRESQVLLATEEIPRSVRIEGRRVSQAASLASLRRAREGWTLAAAPFPGIVLKLAPRAGVARAVVSLP
jgi:hypothetical protein